MRIWQVFLVRSWLVKVKWEFRVMFYKQYAVSPVKFSVVGVWSSRLVSLSIICIKAYMPKTALWHYWFLHEWLIDWFYPFGKLKLIYHKTFGKTVPVLCVLKNCCSNLRAVKYVQIFLLWNLQMKECECSCVVYMSNPCLTVYAQSPTPYNIPFSGSQQVLSSPLCISRIDHTPASLFISPCLELWPSPLFFYFSL